MRQKLSIEEIVGLASSGQAELAEIECEHFVACTPEHASAWNLLGALRLQHQKLPQAKAALQQALALQPQLAKAHHNLGSVFAAENRTTEAIASYRQALEIDASLAPAHYAIASLLNDAQRYSEAIPHLQALMHSQKSPDILVQLADTLQNAGSLVAAADELEKYASTFSDTPFYLNRLGNARLELRQFSGAMAAYEHAIAIAPENPLAYNNLGVALLKQHMLDEAVAAFRKAVALAPENPDFLFSLGSALTDRGKTDESIPLLEQGTKRWPNNVNGLTNLGLAYVTARQAKRGLPPLQQALLLEPNDPELHNNLGAAYEALNEYEQAATCYRQALNIKADYPQPLNNLGNIALAKLDLDEAISFYQQGIALEPNLADAHMNLGLVHLLRGEFEEGWREYEWRRFATSEKNKQQSFSQPEWQGEPIIGKRILLHAEQGLGDTIQFARYARLVKEREQATVILQCQPPLTRLLQSAKGIDTLVDTDTQLPAFDIHASLLSLPHRLKTTIDSIPDQAPYLAAEPDLKSDWTERLKQFTGLRIGFAWAGNPTHRNDKNRSCELAPFLSLSELPGTVFFSLQKGPASAELPRKTGTSGQKIFDFTNELKDFADTAALLANLDLLITVDTSLAHLAGAIGIRTWLLLPYSPDWRWLLARSDSPWYKNLRLFRQEAIGDWPSVFKQIQHCLLQLSK